MPKKESLEFGAALFTVLGFVVICFLIIQLHGSEIWISRTPHIYTVEAVFENIGGLKVGAPVKLAGVKVGRITAISLESSGGYKAVVGLSLEAGYGNIPLDSIAAIQTASLVGGNFIAITPGGSATPLIDRSEMHAGNSAFSLERLIGSLACGHHAGNCTQSSGH